MYVRILLEQKVELYFLLLLFWRYFLNEWFKVKEKRLFKKRGKEKKRERIKLKVWRKKKREC